MKFFIYSPGTQEESVIFFRGISAADASGCYVNELGNSIPSLLLLLGTPEENNHYMLVSIGVARPSKNG